MVNKSGQMKIQQMAFMILAVFFFFILVGLFFLALEFRDVSKNSGELAKEQAISAIKVISDSEEFNCNSRETLCIDEDKLYAMSTLNYNSFWPVSSIKVYKIYPAFNEVKKCPGTDCNYYEVFNNNQSKINEYSTFVSICKKVREFEYVYDKCEIGKLVVGVKSNGK
jgi:hypothetical protein